MAQAAVAMTDDGLGHGLDHGGGVDHGRGVDDGLGHDLVGHWMDNLFTIIWAG